MWNKIKSCTLAALLGLLTGVLLRYIVELFG